MARHKRERREREKREIFFCSLKKGRSDLACSGLTFEAPPFRLAFCFSFALVTSDTKAILSRLKRAISCYLGHVVTVNESFFLVSLIAPSCPFMTAFEGNAVAHWWISNQPTGKWNCGNSWESPWGREFLQDHFLSVWFRNTQGCSILPPRRPRRGLSGKFLSLYGTALKALGGAGKLRSLLCLSHRLRSKYEYAYS